MSVDVAVYCIPPVDAKHVSAHALALALLEARVVEAPIALGPATQTCGGEEYIVSPEGLLWPGEPGVCWTGSVEQASVRLRGQSRDWTGQLAMSVAAVDMRRESATFHDAPVSAGIVHVPRGVRLVVGEPEDLSDLVAEGVITDPGPHETPLFDGTVCTYFVLRGKNAPLIEDFVGSRLHAALRSAWPDARFLSEVIP